MDKRSKTALRISRMNEPLTFFERKKSRPLRVGLTVRRHPPPSAIVVNVFVVLAEGAV
jgi:hypothetical protein